MTRNPHDPETFTAHEPDADGVVESIRAVGCLAGSTKSGETRPIIELTLRLVGGHQVTYLVPMPNADAAARLADRIRSEARAAHAMQRALEREARP